MKKLITICAVAVVVLAVSGAAQATPVTINLNSTVSDWGFYMGSGYNPPLFQIGNPLSVTVVYDGTSLISMQYTITASSGTFQSTTTNFVDYTTGVSSVDGGIFIFASNNAFLQNWALLYGQVHNPDLFSCNMQHVEGQTELYAYNFNSVPEPATICLLGLGGLALMRKRRA